MHIPPHVSLPDRRIIYTPIISVFFPKGQSANSVYQHIFLTSKEPLHELPSHNSPSHFIFITNHNIFAAVFTTSLHTSNAFPSISYILISYTMCPIRTLSHTGPEYPSWSCFSDLPRYYRSSWHRLPLRQIYPSLRRLLPVRQECQGSR